jgi:hypothetical protein
VAEFPPRVYCLVFHGEGFEIAADEAPPEPYGFYTTRWVRADNQRDAEAAGLVDVNRELRAKEIACLPDAWIRLDEVRIEPFHRAFLHWLGFRRRFGFAFFALRDDGTQDGPLRTYVMERDGDQRRWRQMPD